MFLCASNLIAARRVRVTGCLNAAAAAAAATADDVEGDVTMRGTHDAQATDDSAASLPPTSSECIRRRSRVMLHYAFLSIDTAAAVSDRDRSTADRPYRNVLGPLHSDQVSIFLLLRRR